MAKEKKPKAPKAATPVEKLVTHALRLAATNPKAKWLGKSNKMLFDENEPNYLAAIEVCLATERPLLQRVGAGAALTGAGFEKVANDLPEDQVATLAKAVAEWLPADERADFLHTVIGRTPLADAELTTMLEEAIAVENAARRAREDASAKRRAAEDASRKALERAQQLITERQQARVAELLRLLEIEGQKPPSARKIVAESIEPKAEVIQRVVATTSEEKDFRRDTATQLATAWRATWQMDKPDAREFLESAMWNISGLKLLGEVGERVAYSGRVHESVAGVFAGDLVRVVRPGWALEEDAGDFVILKAMVEK